MAQVNNVYGIADQLLPFSRSRNTNRIKFAMKIWDENDEYKIAFIEVRKNEESIVADFNSESIGTTIILIDAGANAFYEVYYAILNFLEDEMADDLNCVFEPNETEWYYE